jgi:hypothetical protein
MRIALMSQSLAPFDLIKNAPNARFAVWAMHGIQIISSPI